MSENPHPIDIHVGKRLRLKRTLLGMSQETLGNAVGITFQQIQKYERGANRMSASRMHDFSRVLGVNIAYFFDGYDNELGDSKSSGYAMGFAESDTPGFEHENVSSRETMDMMRAFYKIANPDVRRSIIDLVKAVADGASAALKDPKSGTKA